MPRQATANLAIQRVTTAKKSSTNKIPVISGRFPSYGRPTSMQKKIGNRPHMRTASNESCELDILSKSTAVDNQTWTKQARSSQQEFIRLRPGTASEVQIAPPRRTIKVLKDEQSLEFTIA